MMMHARTLAATLLAAVTLATGGTVAAHAGEHAPAPTADQHRAAVTPPARAAWMVRPCAEEDSTNCAWNARVRGNGTGHSFYSVRRPVVDAHGAIVGRVVCVYYARHADARRWDACHLLPAGQDGTLGR